MSGFHTTRVSNRDKTGEQCMQRPQFELRDLFALLLLFAIVIGAVAERVRTLPKEVAIAGSGLRAPADKPSITLRTRPQKWGAVLVGAIVIGATTILCAFVGARRLTANWTLAVRGPVARVTAALACTLFLACFAFTYVEAYHYFVQQLFAGDWRYVLSGEWINNVAYVRWYSVGCAAVAACMIILIEIASLLAGACHARRVKPLHSQPA
jgi:hypothetical protein